MAPEDARASLLPVETALDDIPALALTEVEARRLASGQSVALLPVAYRQDLGNIASAEVICAMQEDRAIALAAVHGAEIRPVRVFNL